MVYLQVTPAEGDAYDYRVECEELVIGRSTRCDLTLADRFLSRQHARLYRKDTDWLIEDLGSRNGTFVNGSRISEPTAVAAGDVIAISASLIKVRGEQVAHGGAAATTSEVVLRPVSDVLLRAQTPPPDELTREPDELRRYADRLAMINQVHRVLARSISLEDVLELILDRAFEHLQPEQGVIFLRRAEDDYVRAASRSLPHVRRELDYSESLVHEVAEKGMAALVLDTLTDDRFAEARSLLDAGVRSLVAAPLLDDEGALGLIMLGCNAAVRRFSEEDLELLVTLASVAALRIRNVSLAEEAAERRRFERELELARRIQLALLPEQLPELDGYQLYGATSPSRVVSGDYYEVIDRRHADQFFVLVADVSGKGIGASLLTGYLEALTVPLLEAGLAPEEVLGRACRTLSRRTPANRFATMLLVQLAPTSGRIRYANAGHVPACLVRSSGQVEWLAATGTPLGLLEECRYATSQTHLDPGDTLVMYTDGITEAENSNEEQFGQERLLELCVALRATPVDELAAAIDRVVDEFSAGAAAFDDRTLVIVRRVSAPVVSRSDGA